MFENLPSYTRLLACIFASFGLHVGVVLFAWMQEPAVVVTDNRPVDVNLVRLSSSEPSRIAEKLVVTPPSVRSTVSTKPPARKIASSKSPPVKEAEIDPSPEPNLKTDVKSPSDEMVCMVPQDILPKNPLRYESRMHNVLTQSSDSKESSLNTDSSTREVKMTSPGAGPFSETLVVGGTPTLVEATPNYRSNPLPEYPFLARQKRWEGVVWLQVEVSTEGRVDDLELERSSGYKVLDRSASRAVKRWQFTPASRAGVPVESRVRIPVRFRLEDS